MVSEPPPVEPLARVKELAPDCRCLLLSENREWRDTTLPFRELRTALLAAGHKVGVVSINHSVRWPFVAETPDCIFVWNGCKGFRARAVAEFLDRDIPVFRLERGFFRRNEYTQLDLCGFNHTASWVGELTNPCPADGAARFAEVWGSRPAALRKRTGYMLVLLQTLGDAQLSGSFYQAPGPLVRAVEAAAPRALDIRVRAHPLFKWNCETRGRARMIGGSLAEAVAGAQFCVTSNSNAGNEALAMGCPVMSIGPSLYSAGGVSPTCSPTSLLDTVELMATGWRPQRKKLNNYLYWLASRQWSREEIGQGGCLQTVLHGTPA